MYICMSGLTFSKGLAESGNVGLHKLLIQVAQDVIAVLQLQRERERERDAWETAVDSKLPPSRALTSKCL